MVFVWVFTYVPGFSHIYPTISRMKAIEYLLWMFNAIWIWKYQIEGSMLNERWRRYRYLYTIVEYYLNFILADDNAYNFYIYIFVIHSINFHTNFRLGVYRDKKIVLSLFYSRPEIKTSHKNTMKPFVKQLC